MVSLIHLLPSLPGRRTPSLRSLILQWYVLRPPTLHLLLYVRSVLQVLLEVAYVAVDGVPGLKAEWNDGSRN